MTEQAKSESISVVAAQEAILAALRASGFATAQAINAATQRIDWMKLHGALLPSGQYYELQHPVHDRFTATLEILVDFFEPVTKKSWIDERGDRVATVKPEVKVNWGSYGAVPFLHASAMAEVLKAVGDIAVRIHEALCGGVTYVAQTAAELAEQAVLHRQREMEQAIINAWAGDEDLRHALYDTRKGVTKHAVLPALLRERAMRDSNTIQHVTYNLMIPGKKTKVYKLGISGDNTYATRIG